MARRTPTRPGSADLRASEGLLALPWLTRRDVRHVWASEGVDERTARLAAVQGGVVERRQLLTLGLTPDEIRGRRERALLHTIYTSVYAVGHVALTRRGRAIGALLAVPDAVLSNVTAAAVDGFLDDDLSRPHVTVAGTHTRRAGIEVHRVRTLDPRDVRIRHGLPVTRPARTLLDLAETAPASLTARALREARVKGLVTPAQLETQLARSPGRRGTKVIRRLLDGPQGEPTQSWAEERLLSLIAQTDLPQPIVNRTAEGARRDFRWPEERLIVELDAYSTHGDAPTFESDRTRDNRAALRDYETRRFTRLAVKHEPLNVLATIACRLGARS